PGNYEIWLHVTDDNGCRDSASIELQVEEYIIIPNVFSPNGDGFNDFFEIPNTGMKEFELTIFNRWGTLLYNTTSANVRWDGRTLSGRMVSEDTYYFELKAVGSEDYSTTGYIMVLF
ncbi:MAG: gliding motility-associated C-terminal domain-containing protein, partial [Flavobacteriales bacterium]|nr:gliding motility-associated C-terminal domain-containing protein [Flavobacteriales bacterium]